MRIPMQATQNKIAKLEEQRAKLDKEILALQKKKNEEFLSLLNKIPSLNLEPMILIGGLLHIIDEANKKPELKEKWRSAAQKFCGKSLHRASSQKPQSS